ncbi:MAG: CDP-glucose 4,6-dehydratase [Bacteroidetes bacterium]|jgi:CDP-glucose 4,6-dehydratase|nr:CDP-glucose 4,6-dehydratase [Bacteroidota bacterium]
MVNNIFDVYKGKKVLVTGNTGFKGSWMSAWLIHLGAKVVGYSLEPPTDPSLYDQLNLKDDLIQYTADVRSYDELKNCIMQERPDIIFYLAAQPLVRESYDIPHETIDVNVMGTVNVLEAVRDLKISTNVVLITSDKSYENKEWLFGYREVDAMGGYDPYSASKGAAEILISSYRRSFFNTENYPSHGVKVASVRAGNVIGGGDWAKDRIVPDCMRALYEGKSIWVRNPYATRPWQHVLEPLGGYLLLGTKLLSDSTDQLDLYCDAFNFGPVISSNKTVQTLVEELLNNWGTGSWDYKQKEAVHEASLLNLTIDKAYHLLRWQPLWDFKDTIQHTVAWYKYNLEKSQTIKDFTEKQIDEYTNSFQLRN